MNQLISSLQDRNSVRGPVRENNKLRPEDRAAHDWYRFVLSFPPHLVRQYLHRFQVDGNKCVLDPFCGTGTTLVECKKQGIRSVGIEANPVACFASRVKVDWNCDASGLMKHAGKVALAVAGQLEEEGIEEDGDLPLFKTRNFGGTRLRTLPAEKLKLLLKDSISPIPLHKTLVLMDFLDTLEDASFGAHERLALAKALVFGISNLNFGPEVGVSPPKSNAPVVSAWLDRVFSMSEDLRELRGKNGVHTVVHQGDSRYPHKFLQPRSIDAVITSPPYPNEKDYTRTTRLESVLLGFVHCKEDLRALKRNLVRSNTRSVYKSDRDDLLIRSFPEIRKIAEAIECRRIELGKTSGFERLYARVTKLYFGGMAKHLSELRNVLRKGARLAYVVGDQASYLRVMIRTGQLLAEIACSLGYELEGIDLFRTRLATATKEQLREEVVVLRWPGWKT